MNKTLIATAVALTALASNAMAYQHFTPANTTLELRGPIQMTIGSTVMNCTAKWAMVIDRRGHATITKAKNAASGGSACVTTAPMLPWPVNGLSATHATFEFSYITPAGPCGPGAIFTTLSGGRFAASNAQVSANCHVSINLKPSVPITIVP